MTKHFTHAEYFFVCSVHRNVVLPSAALFHLSCLADLSKRGWTSISCACGCWEGLPRKGGSSLNFLEKSAPFCHFQENGASR